MIKTVKGFWKCRELRLRYAEVLLGKLGKTRRDPTNEVRRCEPRHPKEMKLPFRRTRKDRAGTV